jgi:hypothetical protein
MAFAREASAIIQAPRSFSWSLGVQVVAKGRERQLQRLSMICFQSVVRRRPTGTKEIWGRRCCGWEYALRVSRELAHQVPGGIPVAHRGSWMMPKLLRGESG